MPAVALESGREEGGDGEEVQSVACKVAADAKPNVDGIVAWRSQDQTMAWEPPVAELQATAWEPPPRQGQQVRKPLAEKRGRSQPSLDAVAVDQGTELEAGPQTGWEAELTTGLVTELATADEPRFS